MNAMLIGPTEVINQIHLIANRLSAAGANVRCDGLHDYTARERLGQNLADTLATADVIVHVEGDASDRRSPWVPMELARAQSIGKRIVTLQASVISQDRLPREVEGLLAEARTSRRMPWPSAYRFEEQPERPIVPNHASVDKHLVTDLLKSPWHRQAAVSTINADGVNPEAIHDYVSQLSDPRLRRRADELLRELGPHGFKSHVLSLIEAALTPQSDDIDDDFDILPLSY